MTVSGNVVSSSMTSGVRAFALMLTCVMALFGVVPQLVSRAAAQDSEVGGGTAADPEPEVSDRERLWSRLLAVELQGAIDGPLGVAGGTLVISPLEALALEVGGGISRDGARVAGGLRLVLPQDHFALQMRVGIAAGPLTWDGRGQSEAGVQYNAQRRWEFSAGMYADVGLQYRFDFGLYLGLHGGVESAFNSAADSCTVTDTGPDVPNECSTGGFRPTRIYLGLQIGYAFDLRI